MAQSKIEGDVRVTGNISCSTLTIPAGSVRNASIEEDAEIEATKLEHKYEPVFAQPNTTATAETRAVHLVHGATGEVLAFKAGSIAACIGDSTITVDLKKNGSSILTSVITLDSSNTNRVAEAGTISGSGAIAVGDLLEVVVAVSAGTGTLGTGVFASVELTELAA